jgi:eukaryotic-like serine/threonine-protein kinase
VLDFGLARMTTLAESSSTPSSPGSTQSPTMTSPAILTHTGVILGTAAYMSPQQARGEAADRSTDVWALGCVVYEMLTGRRAFEADGVANTLAAILREEPDWSALPADTPEPLRRLLRRSLEKDSRRRLPEMGSARIEIADAAAALTDAAAGIVAPRAGPRPGRRLVGALALVLAGLAGIAVGVGVATLLRRPPQLTEMHVEIATPPTTDPVSFALSPDGRKLVYVASSDRRSQLWLRSLDTGVVQALRDTEGGSHPFWAPDSRSIGFSARRALYRLDLDGTPPRRLAAAPAFSGGAWSPDGVILFTLVGDAPLSRVASTGGEAVMMPYESESARGQRFPQFLPDGRHFLYFVADAAGRGTYLGELDHVERARLLDTDTAAVYAAGRLYFGRGGSLFVQDFDPERLVLVGPARLLADQLEADSFGRPALSASATGSVVYRTGSGGPRQRLVWVDRTGSELSETYALEADSGNLALSPRGDVVALSRNIEGNSDIWLLELERGVFTRLTFDPAPEVYPVWSADGGRVAYSARLSEPAPPVGGGGRQSTSPRTVG